MENVNKSFSNTSESDRKLKKASENKAEHSEKSAINNQWFSTGLNHYPDNRERRDGPGGDGKEN